MKKIGILNHEISEVIAKMGHTDSIAIGDCGLPIPDETKRIDLALIKDIPTFVDTLKAVLLELKVEEVVVAEEQFPHVDVSVGKPILEVKNLSWGNRIKDVSFELR